MEEKTQTFKTWIDTFKKSITKKLADLPAKKSTYKIKSINLNQQQPNKILLKNKILFLRAT